MNVYTISIGRLNGQCNQKVLISLVNKTYLEDPSERVQDQMTIPRAPSTVSLLILRIKVVRIKDKQP